ncbi:epididymal sperm-binding protein 1 [Anolis carolinensis]|uniref:Fibronectin type-II domain-containing protein n=1 Tax=Anolis carolinensis TaxID=28377 RepID=H9GGR1_ANOCA|nr:PREDICTED: epididymal sperm-binding protein 1-like [Anolis carolinensis]|eukprot:XP_016851306.1 PREDICTED: epididymal sperm-binding protein 1-like [Anolis carolinensis]
MYKRVYWPMQRENEMAFIMIFLFCASALLPLLVTGDVPPPCVFPFIYHRQSYSSCTNIGTGEKTWCATTANYDTSPKWKYCSPQEYGGNSGGKPCVFPFTYKKRTFYTCTNEDAAIGRFWCATTGSYDKDKQWSYCADTRLAANSQGPCIFPFIYKGKSYSSCTTAGASTGKLWCSLTSNYDTNPRWTYCDPSEPRPCAFPFIFGGKSYSTCTKKGSADGQLWCATTNNYERDSKWKACSIQEYGGNSKGKVCVFPFIYKGKTFKRCTNENSSDGRFWCATTRNYDKDKQWSYCADTSNQNQCL